MPGTCDRYSSRVVSRPAKPRCQPSIIASEKAHPHAVAQVPSVSIRHESRCATTVPTPRRRAAIRIAGTRSPAGVDVPVAEDRCGAGPRGEALQADIAARVDAQVQPRQDERGRHQDSPDRDGKLSRRPTLTIDQPIDRPANRRTNADRSTLPMPRRGSASTMCSSRGAAVRVQGARHVGAQRVQRRRSAAVAHHDRGDHPLAQPVVGKPEHRAVRDGGMGAQRGLDGLRQHGQARRC